MFEFRAKPRTVQKQNVPINRQESHALYKPLILEKNYIADQEKLMKMEFLNKWPKQTPRRIQEQQERFAVRHQNQL